MLHCAGFALLWLWGFLCGAYVLYVLNFPTFGSDFFKIKISDLINSTVALIIAFLVTYSLNKKSSTDFKVRELFIERLSSITEIAKHSHELCYKYNDVSIDSKNEWRALVLLIGQISKHLSSLFKHAKTYDVRILCANDIKENFLHYKSAITGDKIDITAATKHYLELLSSLEKAKIEIYTC